ncbi:trypsin-like peptidase domain-containing protein [Anaeromyxobacter diazotrophicus]|uniref:Peptidase S1 and S6 chymotrypsin/Hap n=1 Tax=Anaeromyxobacter diazotrophicus TaxID=2590199 RepID=A0A7I9VR73_9BACT|nr:trypsin-like peptidase domain-containing protein [Anaeromyxobacter diazotrophicus]GEJ58923.1 hypothetical protein AMYX_36640 [Anaeromyxobacter diazotrophicus]
MTASAPQLDLCHACGQQSDSDSGCTRCGANLRVDLWLDAPVPEERARFLAARGLAALGLPGGSFSELKRALASPAVPLAVALPRSAARAAIDVLGRHGIGASARPAGPRPGRAFPSAAIAAIAGGAAALVLAGALLFSSRAPRSAAPPAATPALPQADASPGDPAAGRPAAAAPIPPSAAPAGALTTQELAQRVLGSVAEVSCGGNLGTAFFVAPERAATNAHVVCDKDTPLRLRFQDGSELVGKTVVLEKRLDLAVIEVPGAGAKPLELGDSTALVPGDGIVLVGNPHGLAFTVHEGKVSFVGRNLLGHAYVQVNASVNPGNSGGPLLDGRGRAVGIVSMKVTGADGIGLALPIEYLRPFAAGLSPATPEAQARWQATLDQVQREDAAEVERYRRKYQQPAIVAVGTGEGGLHAMVLRRWPSGPSRLAVTVDVQAGGKTLCTAEGSVTGWEKVEDALEKALRDAPDQPRLVWASENHTLRDVYAGTLPLDLGRCALAEVPASAVLVVRGGDEADSPIRMPKPSDLEASVRFAAAQGRARRASEEQEEARAEADWRGAFRRLRREVGALEARREQLKEAVANSVPTSDPKDPRRQLAEVEGRLAKARDALQDLERQASSASIPRAWRE